MKVLKKIVNYLISLINNFYKKIDKYYFLRLCYLTIGFLFFISFTTSVMFLCHLKIEMYNFYISIIILILGYYYLFYKRSDKKMFYINLLTALVIITISIISSMLLFENSWDGWAYHIPSVIDMKNGWNPVYEHNESIGIWSLHYPKFIWTYGAVLYKALGNMSAGTSFNLIISFSSMFLLLHLFNNLRKNPVKNLIFSLIVSFNFISVRQFFSYYNDGVLGICILTSLFVFYYFLKSKKSSLNDSDENFNIYILLISMYLSVLANIKFDGALFAFILAFFIFVYLIIIKSKKSKILLFILLLGTSVLIPACTTYLPNIIYHHNIGYPIIGENKIDIIDIFIPEYMTGDGKVLSFIKSFSCDSNVDSYCKFKPFFKTSIEDIKSASTTDSSLNGFGPLYQLILILFIIYALSYIIKIIKENKNKKISLSTIIKQYYSELTLIFILLIFFFITPATWWFRYVPYMYVLPLIIINFSSKETIKKQTQSILALIIVGIYIFNLMFFGTTRVLSQINFSLNLNNQVNELIDLSTVEKVSIKEIDVDETYYKRIVRNEIFKNNQIKYLVIDETEKCKLINDYYVFSIETYDCNSINLK